jgi:hypothetical protein
MRKNNCKGTIYKINNRTYCVGEKNESKKSKKTNKSRKNKSKKSKKKNKSRKNKSKRLRVKLKNSNYS